MKYLLCIVLPPVACLAVNRKAAALINLPLTLLLWLPGVIHAFVVVMGAEADRRHREVMKAMQERGG